MSGQPIAVRDVQADARFARDVAESTHYVPTAIYAAPMLDADGEVLGVVSVLDPVVDETSDWTLNVLGTHRRTHRMVITCHGGCWARAEPLAQLGSDVLRLVATWQAGEPGRRG